MHFLMLFHFFSTGTFQPPSLCKCVAGADVETNMLLASLEVEQFFSPGKWCLEDETFAFPIGKYKVGPLLVINGIITPVTHL